MKVELPEKIYDEIKEYCRVNNIDDVDKFIRKILNQGFTTEKWGVIGENKEPKKEIVERIIISAVTSEPEIRVVEKIVYSAVTVEPEVRVVEKIIYSGTGEPEVRFVEKIVISATTNEITTVVNTGDTINYVYNVFVKPEPQKKIIDNSRDNADLYGERNIRKA